MNRKSIRWRSDQHVTTGTDYTSHSPDDSERIGTVFEHFATENGVVLFLRKYSWCPQQFGIDDKIDIWSSLLIYA